jgi:hypothetical protein
MNSLPMMPAEPCSAMLDTMSEDFVRLSSGELNYLVAALQYINKNIQVHLENHTKVDGTELYAKLFAAWEALDEPNN